MTSTQERHAGDPAVAAPVGSYCRVGGLVLTLGLTGTGPDGVLVGPDDCARQLDQALDNLADTLRAAGSAPERILKITYYVRDRDTLPEGARGALSVDCWPSYSVVELPSLPPGVLVELEAVATVGPA